MSTDWTELFHLRVDPGLLRLQDDDGENQQARRLVNLFNRYADGRGCGPTELALDRRTLFIGLGGASLGELNTLLAALVEGEVLGVGDVPPPDEAEPPEPVAVPAAATKATQGTLF